MEKRNELILTIGLPFSGKSTWSQQHGAPVVCPDSIRLALHGQRYVERAEPIVWAAAKLMVRSLFRAGHNTVILNACNNTKKRRDDWKDPEWFRLYIVLDVHPNVCLDRAQEAKDGVIVPIIERMAETMEYEGVYYGCYEDDSDYDAQMRNFVTFPGRDEVQVYHTGSAND